MLDQSNWKVFGNSAQEADRELFHGRFHEGLNVKCHFWLD